MSARKSKPGADLPDVERQANRLLRALAEPGASAKPTDIPRPGLLAITGKRKGISLAPPTFPLPPARISSRRIWRAGVRRATAPCLNHRGRPRQAPACRRAAARAIPGPASRDRRCRPRAALAGEAQRGGKPACLARAPQGPGRPRLLDPTSFAAGERFRKDFTLAGLQPRVTSDWSSPVSGASLGDCGMHITDLMIAARQRLDAALEALGPELGSLVIDVCGFLKGLETVEAEHGWPARSAKVVLGTALTRLAGHYGLASEARGPRRAKKLLHWGAEDYRPKISADG